jgi:uncharacterized FlaG/YvyC family protein
MELDTVQAPLAPPVAKTAPKVSAAPAEPLAAPVAPLDPTAAAPAAVGPAPAAPVAPAAPAPSPTSTQPAVAEALQRKAEDQAAQSRKRMELAEKLVGANKSLVIEKDPSKAAGFIYKTVDKTTGEVVRVWPQVEFQSQLAALSDVDARGIMINARA